MTQSSREPEKNSKSVRTDQSGSSKEDRELQKVLLLLSTITDSIAMKEGERTKHNIMLLYKEELELYGVDINKVTHGSIVDTLGIIRKGMKFKVDFYETNDHIYLLEIRNYADDDAYEHIFIRKKLISALFNKPLKVFLVSNFVEDKVKEKLEKEGVVVIAGTVVNTD